MLALCYVCVWLVGVCVVLYVVGVFCSMGMCACCVGSVRGIFCFVLVCVLSSAWCVCCVLSGRCVFCLSGGRCVFGSYGRCVFNSQHFGLNSRRPPQIPTAVAALPMAESRPQ